jgi:hypothetical protein
VANGSWSRKAANCYLVIFVRSISRVAGNVTSENLGGAQELLWMVSGSTCNRVRVIEMGGAPMSFLVHQHREYMAT